MFGANFWRWIGTSDSFYSINMVKRGYYVIIVIMSLFTFFTSQHCSAQGIIKTEEVDIIKPYQPLLADAEKIEFKAQPARVDSNIEVLDYDVKSHLIEVPFIPAEIRAVSLPKEEVILSQDNLVKAGFGTQLTPLIDLYLHNGASEKFSYGLNFHHLSSNGSKVDFQDFSHTGGTAFGTAYVGTTALSGSIGYDHRKNFHYAESFLDTSEFNKKLLKHTYNYVPVEVGFRNTKILKGDWDYNINLKYHNFSNVPNSSSSLQDKENYLNFNFIVHKQIEKIHSANLEFILQNLNYRQLSFYDTTQSVFSLIPYYQLSLERLSLTAGMNLNFFNNSVSFFPKLGAEYKLLGDYLIPYFGWEGGWRAATLQESTTVNPYLNNFQNSFSKISDIFLGVKGSYGNNFSYNIKGGFGTYTNMPFYLPDASNPAYYNVIYYANANIFKLHGEIGYKQSERINVVLRGETESYSLDFDDEPWGIPKSKLQLTFNYNIQNKIFAQADFFANSGAYTIMPGDSASTHLNGRADVNLSLTYNYKKNIAFWIALNNITGSKNSLWYNYPTYGFQAMAGVKLMF